MVRFILITFITVIVTILVIVIIRVWGTVTSPLSIAIGSAR